MAHEAKTLTRLKYKGTSYPAGQTVKFDSAEDAKPYLAAGAIEAGKDAPELEASQTTLGGANPATGRGGAGPNRSDIPVDQVKGKRAERETLASATAGNPSGAATPAGRNATPPAGAAGTAATPTGGERRAAGGTPNTFDYSGASVDEVEAEFNARGLTAAGSGKDGNLLKSDMVKALEADDATRAGA